jgi:(S)-mandelate dehydrogenase
MGSPSSPQDWRHWRRQARKRLPKFVFDYVEGGADEELAIARNEEALRRILLLPARLTAVDTIDLQTTLFGKRFASPLIVAPVGLCGLLWPDGDICMARAAARASMPLMVPTAATTSMEQVAAVSPGEKWFQLYMLQDHSVTHSLIDRASACEFRVLVLTVDVAINGHRARDLRNGFVFPLQATPRLCADVFAHPRWAWQLLQHGIPSLANLECAGESGGQAKVALLQRRMDRSFTWRRLEEIRSRWHGAIVLKGILRARDAKRAVDCGIDGIVVSNHGGRQLDCVPSSMDVLESVLTAVAGKLEVLVDGGFRRGSDVIKALALGARGVLIGRPALYGLGAAGERGVFAVLDYLLADIQRTMTLLGVSRLTDLTPQYTMRV